MAGCEFPRTFPVRLSPNLLVLCHLVFFWKTFFFFTLFFSTSPTMLKVLLRLRNFCLFLRRCFFNFSLKFDSFRLLSSSGTMFQYLLVLNENLWRATWSRNFGIIIWLPRRITRSFTKRIVCSPISFGLTCCFILKMSSYLITELPFAILWTRTRSVNIRYNIQLSHRLVMKEWREELWRNYYEIYNHRITLSR